MLRNGDSRESPTPSPWATRHAWPQGFEQAIRARGSRSPGLRKVLPVVIQHDNHSMRERRETRATHRPKSHGTSAPLSIRSPDAVVARSARNDRVSFFLFWGVFSARWAALAAVFSASRRPDWKLLVSAQYPVTSCNFPRPGPMSAESRSFFGGAAAGGGSNLKRRRAPFFKPKLASIFLSHLRWRSTA